jgi:hypothetical protein
MSHIDIPDRLDPKEPTEIIPIKWTYADASIVVTLATSAISVVEGVDPNPSPMLLSIAYSANTITQKVQGGIHGVTYKIKMTSTLADGSKFVHAVLLPVFAA